MQLTYGEVPNLTSLFPKKNQVCNEKVQKDEVKDFDHQNGAQNLKPQLSQLFLDQIDLIQEADQFGDSLYVG